MGLGSRAAGGSYEVKPHRTMSSIRRFASAW